MSSLQDNVTALIEVKTAPGHGDGYDRIAQRITQYEQVSSVYLTTGTHDLLVEMTVKSMQEAANFVCEHIATIAGVEGTETRFIMKKYKERGKALTELTEQEERINFV